jgi:hypothetical protein
MLSFYQIFTARSRHAGEQFSECPQVFDADRGMIRQWQGRADCSIKHPAWHLQHLKPTITLERGLNARHSLSRMRPVDGHFQAIPGMPTVMDLQLDTMRLVLRGCITTLGPSIIGEKLADSKRNRTADQRQSPHNPAGRRTPSSLSKSRIRNSEMARR